MWLEKPRSCKIATRATYRLTNSSCNSFQDSLMDNDIDLHCIRSYNFVRDILGVNKGVPFGDFEYDDFGIYKIYYFDLFSHVNILYPSPFKIN